MCCWVSTDLHNACCAFLLTLADIHHHKHLSLKMDEAQLTVNNELSYEVQVSWMSQRCYQCLYQQLGVVPAGLEPGQPSSVNFVVSTQHEITLQINSTPIELELCKIPFHFGEHGNYSLWVKTLNASFGVNCSVVTDKDPVNSYIPILVAFLIYALLALVFAIGKKVWGLDAVRGLVLRLGSSMETERLINSELGPTRVVPPVTDNILPPPLTSSRRLRSLDTFRGISLVIMVFVNYGGGRYWFFRHESWNGLTVADLVFPWFVFIMGTSIALSINALLRAGATRCSLLRKAVWRSLQLFIIGVLVINPNYCQGALAWENLRIPGVLQRLAWSYLVVACLDLLVARGQLDVLTVVSLFFFSFSSALFNSLCCFMLNRFMLNLCLRKGDVFNGVGFIFQDAWWSPAIDFLLYWPAWLCVILLEVLWLFLTFQLPVPDCPAGYLGPGGIGDMGLYVNCTGGAAGFIDRLLLGEKHMYQNPSSRVIYATRIPYDPEGVLGSINSILMAFLGLQAGKIILHYRERPKSIMSRFLIWGLLLGVVSAFLTKCSTDQGFIPVNKNLWSLSYVTTLACFAFVLLMLIYYIVDVNKWWSGAPFYYPGMNSILVYVGHEVFEDYFPFRWRMSNSQSHAEHLIQNLVATSCWVIISYLLYKKKIFWKI
uniref:Heparan-alpha-glucosaminide N-acetyltransferase n=2 Tax=Pseudocrenilabrinae TaxID=318546 RepID=A0A3Q3C3Z8_HAPBU